MHKFESPLKAIRAHCIDCCCGQIYEVRKCTAYNCNLWGFRMGHRPKVKTIEENISDDEYPTLSADLSEEQED